MEEENEEQIEKGLSILIMPSFDTVRESMGYEEYDYFNVDAILFQQGYDGDLIKVNDEEAFEIPEGFVVKLSTEEDYFILSDEADFDD